MKAELVIRAEGELRDKDGNLISDQPVEGQTVLTEEQAKQLLEKLAESEESE